MKPPLKSIDEQTIVLTGATSGIGLATARQAATMSARLVLAARDAEGLRQLAEELGDQSVQVVTVVADVGSSEDIQRIAAAAIERFGAIDTWINNAGVSIWGRLDEVTEADSRRLFDTNFWGMVNGSLAAVRILKERGGAIINLGSVASDVALPLQGMYCASKHAIKAFTDALRMELAAAGTPISVTLIKPAGIDTPFPAHARNYMAEQPKLPPPVYPPADVARAILYAATHPRREIFVGGGGRLLSANQRFAPGLLERWLGRVGFALQKRDEPARDRDGSLHRARGGLQERGDHPGHVARTSLYTRALLHPWLTTAVLGVAIAGAIGVARSARA